MIPQLKSRKRPPKPQLRVVFDTSVLYTGSASDLVRQEVVDLIKASTYPDLDIGWYLPEIVRHERQHQMQGKALELLPGIAKVEKLLSHNLLINEEILIERVDKVVSGHHQELGLLNLKLDTTRVDWDSVALDAAYRRPPFEVGKTEKGFRDRIIVECFLQLVADSPKTPKVCRLVLVSGDRLIAQAIEARTSGLINIQTLSSIEELKGLINALVSQADEAFLALMRPKADELFFVPKKESTVFYKANVRENLKRKFATELDARPPGTTSRMNKTWQINSPNFVKKTSVRIQWTSRIEIEAEATKPSPESPAIESSWFKVDPGLDMLSKTRPCTGISDILGIENSGAENVLMAIPPSAFTKPLGIGNLGAYTFNLGNAGSVRSHKGVDVYEVLWSADVTTSRELRRPCVDEIRHVGATWEPLS